MIGLREFEDGVCRIDGLEHVNTKPMRFKLERLGPMPQRHEPLDALVMPLLVERGIERDAPEQPQLPKRRSTV